MSTKTGGTNANTSLVALQFFPGWNSGMAAADVATFALDIKDDIINSHPIKQEAFSSNGLLYVPNRGVLKMLPGDWAMVDATTGWPILVSKRAMTSGPWHHS